MCPNLISVEVTGDGSPTLYRSDIDEHYHSTHGALAESRHVFIDCGLLYRASLTPERPLKVFEIGFGTGLNALLTAITGIPVHYTTIEKYPLDTELKALTAYPAIADNKLFENIHSAAWNKPAIITPTFMLTKIHGDMTSKSIADKFDVIFLDAFSPEKQPELWTEDMLSVYASLLNRQGVLTTYCAKGRIRRAFQSLGMKVERLDGPPGGKREILRASKQAVD